LSDVLDEPGTYTCEACGTVYGSSLAAIDCAEEDDADPRATRRRGARITD